MHINRTYKSAKSTVCAFSQVPLQASVATDEMYCSQTGDWCWHQNHMHHPCLGLDPINPWSSLYLCFCANLFLSYELSSPSHKPFVPNLPWPSHNPIKSSLKAQLVQRGLGLTLKSCCYCTSVHKTSLLYKCTQNHFTVRLYTVLVYQLIMKGMYIVHGQNIRERT